MCAIKRAIQVCFDRLTPFIRRQLRCAAVDPDPGIVHQDAQLSQVFRRDPFID